MASRIVNFFGFSFLLGVSLAYIILYWLGYEVIRNPFSSIKEQTDHRKRRNLMLSLGEQIEYYFEKDPDSESVFRSFYFWTILAGVSHCEVRINNEIISQSGVKDSSQRILSFRQGSCEVLLALHESSWTIDSDLKENLMESVTKALIKRLKQLEHSSATPLNQANN